MNLPTHLRIRQAGEEDLELTARYRGRPFQQPLYYAWRLGLRSPGSSWEIQLIHHKLHLRNPPAEVQHLEITHGFNLITLNYAVDHAPVAVRFGAGLVLPHVSAVVRNREFSSRGGILGLGYRLTGPALLLGIGKRWATATRLSLGVEAQCTAGWARIPVRDGRITTSNVALHGLVGVGYRF